MYILILYFLYNRTDFSTLNLCGFLWFRDGHTIKCPLIPFKTERALQNFLVCLTPIQKRDRFYIGRWLKTMAHSCALFSFSKVQNTTGSRLQPIIQKQYTEDGTLFFYLPFLLTFNVTIILKHSLNSYIRRKKNWNSFYKIKWAKNRRVIASPSLKHSLYTCCIHP